MSLAPIFCKNQSALTPLLLLCAKSHADCGYALINAGMMPPLRYQLFVQIYRSKMGGHLFCYRLTRRDGLREHNPVRISGRDFLSPRHRSFSARKLGCALVRKLSLFPCSFYLLSCKSSVCGLMFLSTIYTAALDFAQASLFVYNMLSICCIILQNMVKFFYHYFYYLR